MRMRVYPCHDKSGRRRRARWHRQRRRNSAMTAGTAVQHRSAWLGASEPSSVASKSCRKDREASSAFALERLGGVRITTPSRPQEALLGSNGSHPRLLRISDVPSAILSRSGRRRGWLCAAIVVARPGTMTTHTTHTHAKRGGGGKGDLEAGPGTQRRDYIPEPWV